MQIHLITDRRRHARFAEQAFQDMENLRAHAQRIAKMRRANGMVAEFLHIKRIVGMCAAIHDVHHWRWQQMRMDTTDSAKAAFRLNPPPPETTAMDTPRIALAPVGHIVGAVQFDQILIKTCLIKRISADNRVENLKIDSVDGFQHAFALYLFLSPSRISTAS